VGGGAYSGQQCRQAAEGTLKPPLRSLSNGVDMDTKVRELMLICLLAACCAGAAWGHNQ
jgi:hypothetical protein